MNKKFLLHLCSFFLPLVFTNSTLAEETKNIKAYSDKDFKNSVSLQAINKVTARVSSFNVQQDNKRNFGNLEVQLVKCWKAPPEEEPENKALLKIWEQIPGEEKREIFFGWMFSSSPALSALEHPVYDIVLKNCINMDKEDADIAQAESSQKD